MLTKEAEKFAEKLPYRPFAADFDKKVFRCSREEAIGMPLLQVNNCSFTRFLVFDLDHYIQENTFNEKEEIPVPNWIVRSPDGSGHVAYEMGVPVTTDREKKQARWLDSIETKLEKKLKADKSYGGLVTKNPLYFWWSVERPRTETYTLEELNEIVKPPKREFRKSNFAELDELNRNQSTFDVARQAAYCVVNSYRSNGDFDGFFLEVMRIVEEAQSYFSNPLPFSEYRHIAKSISKWTWNNFEFSGKGRKRRGIMKANLSGEMTLKEKQTAAAKFCHRSNSNNKKSKIQNHIKLQRDLGNDVSKSAVSKSLKVSRMSVIKYWLTVEEYPVKKVEPKKEPRYSKEDVFKILPIYD